MDPNVIFEIRFYPRVEGEGLCSYGVVFGPTEDNLVSLGVFQYDPDEIDAREEAFRMALACIEGAEQMQIIYEALIKHGLGSGRSTSRLSHLFAPKNTFWDEWDNGFCLIDFNGNPLNQHWCKTLVEAEEEAKRIKAEEKSSDSEIRREVVAKWRRLLRWTEYRTDCGEPARREIPKRK